MKIRPDDYEKLKTAVLGIITQHPDVEARYQAKRYSPKRLRWDLLYASKIKLGDGVGMHGDVNVYGYANDDHIDTALRAIMTEAGLTWAAQKLEEGA